MPKFKLFDRRMKPIEINTTYTDLKKVIKLIICGVCGKRSFKLKRTIRGNFDVGFQHLLVCKKCKGELSIQEDTLD